MKKRTLITVVCLVALSLACMLCLAACGSDKHTGGVAATVNDLEIKEDDVTDYVESFRESYDMTDDDTWAYYMGTYGVTAETLREQIIEMFEEEKAAVIAAELKGISVDSSEIDEKVSTMKANFNSDSEWSTALESAGFTEESYREAVEQGILEDKLEQAVATETTATDDLVLTYAKAFAKKYNNAKKSSHILFASSDTEQAQKVLDSINSGELDFAEAAKQYSTDTGSASDGGNVGWDCLTTFVDAYQQGLDKLDEGEVSDLVTSDYGIHIIKCTETCQIDGELKSLDQLPAELQENARSLVTTMCASASDFSTWLSTFTSGLKIVVNDMPEKVSYNVDTSAYTSTSTSSYTTSTTTDTSTTADTTSSQTTTSN